MGRLLVVRRESVEFLSGIRGPTVCSWGMFHVLVGGSVGNPRGAHEVGVAGCRWVAYGSHVGHFWGDRGPSMGRSRDVPVEPKGCLWGVRVVFLRRPCGIRGVLPSVRR